MAEYSGYDNCVALAEPGGTLASVLPADQAGSGITWHLPAEMGFGHFKTECLPYGLALTVSRCKLDTGLFARLRDSTGDLTLVFSLTGRVGSRF